MAEEEGFEPPCESPRKRFSRPPVSTTHPFLRGLPYYTGAPLYWRPAPVPTRQQQIDLLPQFRQAPHHLIVLDRILRRRFSLNMERPARLQHTPLHLCHAV